MSKRHHVDIVAPGPGKTVQRFLCKPDKDDLGVPQELMVLFFFFFKGSFLGPHEVYQKPVQASNRA